MTTKQLLALVEELEENIDEVEENLEPLFNNNLTNTTKRLPLLDKAKLYVVVVYTIESLLFSYLRLNGVDAKEHPIFRELTRVKQYFEKIKIAEAGPSKARDNLSLDKEAAGRLIQHALAGNQRLDLERAEREAKEKFLAKRKLKDLESRMKEKAQIQGDESVQDIITNESTETSSAIVTPETQNDTNGIPGLGNEVSELEESTVTERKRKRNGEDLHSPIKSEDITNSKKARRRMKKALEADIDVPTDG